VLLDALLALEPDALVWGARIAHVQQKNTDETDKKDSQNDAYVQEIKTDECLEKYSQTREARMAHVQQIHTDENGSDLQEIHTDEADVPRRSTHPRRRFPQSSPQIHAHQSGPPQKSSENVSRGGGGGAAGMGGWDAEVEGSHVEVRLEDGRSFVAHACVGCDGIHSRMRRFVSGSSWTPLRYLGYIVVLGIFDNASFPLTQSRAFQTSDGRARLFAMPFTAELSMWQLSWAMPEEEAVAVSKSTDLLRAAALQVSSYSNNSSLY
jgi:2-polyprenyl-6-methoxyphenol hydroxylase-like FAD-dependent oxidoreductase